MNARMRASIHLFPDPQRGAGQDLHDRTGHIVVFLDQATILNSVGSEFLRDGTHKGQDECRRGLRHEDLTALSFPDGSLSIWSFHWR